MQDENVIRFGNVYGNFDGGNYAGMVYDYRYLSPTLNTMEGGGRQPMIVVCDDVNKQSEGDYKVIEKDSNVGYRIRKLTPRECWRLMGFSDEDFDKAVKAGVSNSQLYKQAGNSIVTNVLYYIFKELYEAMPYLFDDLKVSSYFSGIGAFEIALSRLFNDINGTPTITPEFSGGREINTTIVYDDYNSNIRNDQNTIGTLRTNIGDSGLRTAYKIIENKTE